MAKTLYFDHSTHVFTLTAGLDCEKVMEEWPLGDNKDHTFNFEVGDLTVQVESHESWPGEQWKFLAAQVSVKGVKLLPYSLASIKGGYYALTQIRIAQNNGKRNTKYEPVTLIERGCERDWYLFLCDLCNVLNHYEQWQIEEFRKYFSLLEEKNVWEKCHTKGWWPAPGRPLHCYQGCIPPRTLSAAPIKVRKFGSSVKCLGI